LNRLTESHVPGGTLGFVIVVVLSNISMMHFASRVVSRVLNGRTRTATLTDDIFLLASMSLSDRDLPLVLLRKVKFSNG
jgi:hypothetical protein